MSWIVRCMAVVTVGVWPWVVLAGEDEVVRRWEFKAEGDAAGWVAGGDAKNFAVADGVLRVVMTGPDAYVFAPAVEAPLDGCLVRVRMRCDHEGGSQVYWTTADRPEFGEGQVVSVAGPRAESGTDGPKDKFATWDFPIGQPSDRGRKLTRFRIDPYNGNPAGTAEIASVELVRQAPVLDVNFSFAQHWVELGKPVAARVTIRHVGGRAPEEKYEVTLSDGRRVQVVATAHTPPSPPLVRGGEQLQPGGVEFIFDRPGVHQVRASVAGADGKVLYDLETSVIAGKGGTLPIAKSISTEHVRLDLIQTAGSELIGAARWMATDAAGEWKLAGWLMPLVEYTVEEKDGRIVRSQPSLPIEPRADKEVLPLYKSIGEGEQPLVVYAACSIPGPKGQHDLRIEGGVLPNEELPLLEFSGPVLLADRDPPGEPLARFAMFGGLEFLEPGWASSSDRAVGERFAARWSPAPHKVTLPVMAVEAGGLTTAMMWKPEPNPAAHGGMPAPTFASPNFLDGQANHLMKLSLPAGTPWRQENENGAWRPYVMPTNQWLSLNYVLHAEAGLPMAMVARRWYETFEALPAPAATHDDKTLYDLIARNFGETMWWPEEKGWRHHWYMGEATSAHIPDIEAELIAHSLKAGERQWVKKTGLEGRAMIDAAGTLAARLGGEGHARAMMAGMRPDGTWAFKNTPELRAQVRKFTQGKYDTLGEDGSTSLGTCVQAALPILHYAEISGDAKCIEAGLKALEAMRQFRVPRGAQVWEVHQDIPDIRAAALAVEAYRLGFRITGDKKYLEDANYWGWTGVPFVYSWAPPMDQAGGGIVAARNRDGTGRTRMAFAEGFEQPRREIMPYATVPVMGPTFYVVNWFGVVVQWCGLEWAEKVIELDADAPDPLLRYVADGVVASGLQQMFDKPPWVGLFPDVWDVEQNVAEGAFIYAGLPLRCLRAQGRTPPWTKTWTRVLRDAGGTTWHVSGWGAEPEKLSGPSAVMWSVRLNYPAGQANELLIAGATAPKRVKIDGQVLERADAADASGAGWKYVGEKKAVMVRFVSPPSGEAEVRVEW